jgi:hypothetical protein
MVKKLKKKGGLMTKLELEIVENELLTIFNSHHNCALSKAERKMPKGRLCDSCLAFIKIHMDHIKLQTQT